VVASNNDDKKSMRRGEQQQQQQQQTTTATAATRPARSRSARTPRRMKRNSANQQQHPQQHQGGLELSSTTRALFSSAACCSAQRSSTAEGATTTDNSSNTTAATPPPTTTINRRTAAERNNSCTSITLSSKNYDGDDDDDDTHSIATASIDDDDDDDTDDEDDDNALACDTTMPTKVAIAIATTKTTAAVVPAPAAPVAVAPRGQPAAVHNAKAMAAKFRLLNRQTKPVQLARHESTGSETTDATDSHQSRQMKERLSKIQQNKERFVRTKARLMKLPPSRGVALKEAVSHNDSSYLEFRIDEDAALTERDMLTLSSHSADLLEKHGVPPVRRRRIRTTRNSTTGAGAAGKKKLYKKTSIETVYKLLSASSSSSCSCNNVLTTTVGTGATGTGITAVATASSNKRQAVHDMVSVSSSANTFAGDDGTYDDTVNDDGDEGFESLRDLSMQRQYHRQQQQQQQQQHQEPVLSVQGEVTTSLSSNVRASRWKVHDAEAHVMAQVPTRPMRAPRTPSTHRATIRLDENNDNDNVGGDNNNNNNNNNNNSSIKTQDSRPIQKIVFEMTPGTKARIVGISQDKDGHFYMSPHTPRGGQKANAFVDGGLVPVTPLTHSPCGYISELTPGSASYMETPSTIHEITSAEGLSPGTWVLLEEDDDDDDDDDYYSESDDDESDSENNDDDDDEDGDDTNKHPKPKDGQDRPHPEERLKSRRKGDPVMILRNLPLLTEDDDDDDSHTNTNMNTNMNTNTNIDTDINTNTNTATGVNRRSKMVGECFNDNTPKLPARRRFSNDDSEK